MAPTAEIDDVPAFVRDLGVRKPGPVNYPSIEDSHKIWMNTKNGGFIVPSGDNLYFDRSGKPWSFTLGVPQLMWSDPQFMVRLSKVVTWQLAEDGYSFLGKDKATGLYTKPIAVAVDPAPLMIPEDKFLSYRDGWAPILEVMDRVSRVLNSTPLDKVTPNTPGLEGLNFKIVKQILEIASESIYYLPELVDPKFANLPTMTVTGHDNLFGQTGTPGITSRDQILENNDSNASGTVLGGAVAETVRKHDRELWEKSRQYVRDNALPDAIRDSVTENAADFTGRTDGLMVTLAPGAGSPSTPEIAALNDAMGFTMVNKTVDLYADENLMVHYNIGLGRNNPIASGGYTRIDPTALYASKKHRIPYVSPSLNKNIEIGAKLGIHDVVNFRAYAWIRDDKGEIIGIERDAEGRPQYESSHYALGPDPNRPGVEPAEWIDVVRAGNFFLSNSHSHLLDDKRLLLPFRLLAEDLIKHDPSVKGPNFRGLMNPPETLTPAQNAKFLELSREEQRLCVMKPPAESGGTGVVLLATVSDAELDKLAADIAARPDFWTVQRIATFAGVPTFQDPNGDGKVEIQNYFVDGRVFFTRKSRNREARKNGGNRRLPGLYTAGNFPLVRTGSEFGNPITNTSAFGGYKYGIVVSSTPVDSRIARGGSAIPPSRRQAAIGMAESAEAAKFLRDFGKALAVLETGKDLNVATIDSLIYEFKSVMGLFDQKFWKLINPLQQRKDKKITSGQLFLKLDRIRDALLATDRFRSGGLEKIVRANLPASGKASTAAYTVEPLAQPKVIRKTFENGKTIEVVETGVYTQSSDPALQRQIEKLRQYGGHVYHVETRINGRLVEERIPSASFRVEDNGVPAMDINMRQAYADSGRAHEDSHMEDWEKEVERLVATGLSRQDAATAAKHVLLDFKSDYASERRALQAEITADLSSASIFNVGPNPRPGKYYEDGATARFAYPETTLIRKIEYELKTKPRLSARTRVGLNRLAEDAMYRAIRTALIMRRQSLKYFEAKRLEASKSNNPLAHFDATNAQFKIDQILSRSLFDEIFAGELTQFRSEHTDRNLRQLYLRVLKQVLFKEKQWQATARQRGRNPRAGLFYGPTDANRLLRMMQQEQQQQ